MRYGRMKSIYSLFDGAYTRMNHFYESYVWLNHLRIETSSWGNLWLNWSNAHMYARFWYTYFQLYFWATFIHGTKGVLIARFIFVCVCMCFLLRLYIYFCYRMQRQRNACVAYQHFTHAIHAKNKILFKKRNTKNHMANQINFYAQFFFPATITNDALMPENQDSSKYMQ